MRVVTPEIASYFARVRMLVRAARRIKASYLSSGEV
jgi:hypothetical protein